MKINSKPLLFSTSIYDRSYSATSKVVESSPNLVDIKMRHTKVSSFTGNLWHTWSFSCVVCEVWWNWLILIGGPRPWWQSWRRVCHRFWLGVPMPPCMSRWLSQPSMLGLITTAPFFPTDTILFPGLHRRNKDVISNLLGSLNLPCSKKIDRLL